jgi:RNA recognition motif-containing protein
MNIYVSNLSFAVQDEDLMSYFAEYGEVSSAKDQDLSNLFASHGEVASAKIVLDKFTNRSKGFGFVEMSDDEAAKKAIAELDGATVDGRSIKVAEARPKEERKPNNSRPSYSNSNSRW